MKSFTTVRDDRQNLDFISRFKKDQWLFVKLTLGPSTGPATASDMRIGLI